MSAQRILLVDDSPIVCAVVAHTLGGAGYIVETIDDPNGLAAAIAQHKPDLLLVDATFPGVDDDALVALVGVHATVLPVVIFSDRAMTEIDVLVERIGARGAVPKDGTLLQSRLAPYLR